MERNYFTTDLSVIVTPLLDWYDSCARILPWREEPTPYHIWISEIMLQQTRVEAVKTYYERFLSQLPDIKSLAEADEEKLLKLWEGLGYYSRVRNLYKAAKIVMEQYGGELPSDFKTLIKLPGIGRYTAGAISSIAYGKPESAVDGNVLRVLSRICASFADISLPQVRKEAEFVLREIIPEGRASSFTQAMMELGAIVCLPNGAPLCGQCPVADVCEAYKCGITQKLPVKKAAAPRKKERKTVLILQRENRLALSKRENKGLLAGMWELPNIPDFMTEQQVRDYLVEKGFQVLAIGPLPKAKHIFSHVEWEMTGFSALVRQGEKMGLEWVNLEQLEQNYAVASAFASYLKIAKEKLT